jgi:hypothetical protein
MIKARLTSLYRRLGLLVWLGLLAFPIAALIHHTSRLPSAYTWFKPLRTLKSVVGLPHFPVTVLVAYVLGALAWRGAWDVEASARSFARALPTRESLPRVLRTLSCIALVVFGDAFVIDSERDMLDLLALVALGLVFAGYRPDRKQLAREVGYALLCSAIFLVVCYFYTIVKALTLCTDRRFDLAIIGLETELFGAPPHRALALWTAAHPGFALLFDWAYFRFFEHMTLTTVLLVALRRRALRTEYLAALALCYLMGGPLYQIFPALGPSYFEPRYFEFLQDPRLLTGTVRGYLQTNTDGVLHGTARQVRTWSYIACMPSLHVAHELVMLYYVRTCKPAFFVSLLFTLLTLVAVVALGWHYPLDSLFGAVVAVLAIAVARSQRRVLLPPEFSGSEDAEPPPVKPVVVPFIQAYLAALRQARAER